eukprot:10505861-Karenia_brevis.AAC.1
MARVLLALRHWLEEKVNIAVEVEKDGEGDLLRGSMLPVLKGNPEGTNPRGPNGEIMKFHGCGSEAHLIAN